MDFANLDFINELIVYDQYNNTNLKKLIEGRAKIKNDLTRAAFLSIIDNVFYLESAVGDALDAWGKILGFSRYVQLDDPLETLTNKDPNFTEFVEVSKVLKQGRLEDDAYRTILLLLSQTQNVSPAITVISPMLSEVLKTRVTISDGLDMKFITYYFRDEMPSWLECVINTYDVLPRPAGMSTKYISAIYRLLHFVTNDAAWNENIAAFWKTRFIDREAEGSYVTNSKPFPIIVYPRDSATQNLIRGERDAKALHKRHLMSWGGTQVLREAAREVNTKQALDKAWVKGTLDTKYEQPRAELVRNTYNWTTRVNNDYDDFLKAYWDINNDLLDEYESIEHVPLSDQIDGLIKDSQLYLNPADGFYYMKTNPNDPFDINYITPFIYFQGINYKYSEGISSHKTCAPTAVLFKQNSQKPGQAHSVPNRRVEIEYCIKDEDNPAIQHYKNEAQQLVDSGDVKAEEVSKLDILYEGYSFYMWASWYLDKVMAQNYIDYRLGNWQKNTYNETLKFYEDMRPHVNKTMYYSSDLIDKVEKNIKKRIKYATAFLNNQRGRQVDYIVNLYDRVKVWTNHTVPNTLNAMDISDEVRERLKTRFLPFKNYDDIKKDSIKKLDNMNFKYLINLGEFKRYISNLKTSIKYNLDEIKKHQGYIGQAQDTIKYIDMRRRFPDEWRWDAMGEGTGTMAWRRNEYEATRQRGGNYNDELMEWIRTNVVRANEHRITMWTNENRRSVDRMAEVTGDLFQNYGLDAYDPHIIN